MTYKSRLYPGDNLQILSQFDAESVDLIYIDPPYNSNRNYNQIYSTPEKEDYAQATAFNDTWKWDDAAIKGYKQLIAQPQLFKLIEGWHEVRGKDGLLAYLISMALRITALHRVLKDTGTFFLHCDPTVSHYLKIILDVVFLPKGNFLNEIIWYYKTGGMSKKWFGRKHDTIFFYSKGKKYYFNPKKEKSYLKHKYGFDNIEIEKDEDGYFTMVGMRDVWDIPALRGNQPEYEGYPTQKPEALLERIIETCSQEGDIVLDAYCGSGTTIVVAERLNRKGIGIDITYQAITLTKNRLDKLGNKDTIGINESSIVDIVGEIVGDPCDMESVEKLIHMEDDPLRKRYEKWAILTFAPYASINEKKGADKGIDGRQLFWTGKETSGKSIFQAKSGGVGRKDIASLNHDREREGAEIAVFITYESPTKPMFEEAKKAGKYENEFLGRTCDRITIVTIQEILDGARMDMMPMVNKPVPYATLIDFM